MRPRPVRGGHPRTTYAQATDPRSTVTVHGPTPPGLSARPRAPPSPPARAVGALTKSYSRLQRAGAATIQFPNIAVTVGLGLINMKNSRPRTGRPSSELGVKDPAARTPRRHTLHSPYTMPYSSVYVSHIYAGSLARPRATARDCKFGHASTMRLGLSSGATALSFPPVSYWRQREQPRY